MGYSKFFRKFREFFAEKWAKTGYFWHFFPNFEKTPGFMPERQNMPDKFLYAKGGLKTPET